MKGLARSGFLKLDDALGARSPSELCRDFLAPSLVVMSNRAERLLCPSPVGAQQSQDIFAKTLFAAFLPRSSSEALKALCAANNQARWALNRHSSTILPRNTPLPLLLIEASTQKAYLKHLGPLIVQEQGPMGH